MPTTKPRLAITITPRTREALARIARAARRPASGVVRDLLDEATPTLEQIASTMEALKAQTEGFRDQMRRKLSAAERSAFHHAAAALDVLAEIERDAKAAAPEVAAQRSPRRGRRPTPGLVTRG